MADHYAGLDITGVPDNNGPWSWPVDSPYSWLSHRFPDATIWHSWRLLPGSDGGFRFNQAQAPGELTSVFLMFNVPTAIYSVANGITIAADETINLLNLRRVSGNTVYDLGSGTGVNPEVPLVQDVTQLLPGESGWQVNPDGTYHLIYHTIGTCPGCEMVLHFYGNLLPVMADGDLNGDGRVNGADILLVGRQLLGLTTLTPGQVAHGDLAPAGQGDGVLTTADLVRLLVQSTQ